MPNKNTQRQLLAAFSQSPDAKLRHLRDFALCARSLRDAKLCYKNATQGSLTILLHHLKSKGGRGSVCSRGTKTHSTCYTLLSLPYNTMSTNAPIKQASLRSSTRSLIERGVEPLGNLNKVYRAHFAWPIL